MKKEETIDIVIPVFNEGENILRLLNAFEKEIRSNVRVLICYDHENDTTLQTLKKFKGKLEIDLVKNKGKYAHGAIMTGLHFSAAPAVFTFMADDDYNAGIIDEMIDRFWEGNDIVCASRFIPGGSMIGCPWLKSILVRVVSFTLYHFAGLPSHDATNAFRLFSRRLLNEVDIESTQGFAYSLELLVKCHRLKWGISEIPAQWVERTLGSSRFQVFRWAPAYLRWFWYAFQTALFKSKKINRTIN